MAKEFEVHCRIGSLEVVEFLLSWHPIVHCRIGSLEEPILQL